MILVFVFKAFGTLVYIQYISFVPMLCGLELVVNVMNFFRYISLMPLLDFISLMQLPWVFVSVECWTCKWYFVLSLLVCMSDVHSLSEWSLWSLFIVIVRFWSSHALLLHSFLLDRIMLTLYAFQVFCLR